MRFIIAIDGPSGAGKGTVARAVARELRCRHVDTGAMYRAVAWRARQQGLRLDDDQAVGALAARARVDVGEGRVSIDGADVTREIRTPEIDAAAAEVARLPRVRAALAACQREYGRSGCLVMEGRDIGTVVFPDADLKIYLDAAPEERARRRAHDPAHASGKGDVGDVASALEARDRSDRTRATSPLTPAADAVLVDTTAVSIDEVVEKVLTLARKRMKQ